MQPVRVWRNHTPLPMPRASANTRGTLSSAGTQAVEVARRVHRMARERLMGRAFFVRPAKYSSFSLKQA